MHGPPGRRLPKAFTISPGRALDERRPARDRASLPTAWKKPRRQQFDRLPSQHAQALSKTGDKRLVKGLWRGVKNSGLVLDFTLQFKHLEPRNNRNSRTDSEPRLKLPNLNNL